MRVQALEGWEARVLEGAAKAGLPLEELFGAEAVDRYKASLRDRIPFSPAVSLNMCMHAGMSFALFACTKMVQILPSHKHTQVITEWHSCASV